MDSLIDAGQISPVIAVFVEAPNSAQEYARGQRDQFAQMFAEELLPHIDDKYRTRANAENRLFMGADEGAYAAIYTAFKYPGTASLLAGQSTHLYPQAGGDELTALVRESEGLSVTFYLDYAIYDTRGDGFHWKDFNESFVELVKEKGFELTSSQVNEGFGFASWRNRSDKILRTFFSTE